MPLGRRSGGGRRRCSGRGARRTATCRRSPSRGPGRSGAGSRSSWRALSWTAASRTAAVGQHAGSTAGASAADEPDERAERRRGRASTSTRPAGAKQASPTARTGIREPTSSCAKRPSRTSLTSRVKRLTTGPVPSVGRLDWPSRYIWRWICRRSVRRDRRTRRQPLRSGGAGAIKASSRIRPSASDDEEIRAPSLLRRFGSGLRTPAARPCAPSAMDRVRRWRCCRRPAGRGPNPRRSRSPG